MTNNSTTHVNRVQLTGKLSINPLLRISRSGNPYYSGKITIDRLSSNKDIIPVVIPQHCLTQNDIAAYSSPTSIVTLNGELHAVHNKLAPRHKRLSMYVKVAAVSLEQDDELHFNSFILDTTIVRTAQTRHTPLGKLIAETMLRLTPTTLVPAIAWNDTATALSHVPQYTQLIVEGRIQSRDFSYIDEATQEVKKQTTLELCVLHYTLKDTEGSSNEETV